MAELKSPFITRMVACPACGMKQPQRFFRLRIFSPGERESDQHVLAYNWSDDLVCRVHPPFHFLLFCSTCYYTDTSHDFSRPGESDFTERTVKSFNRAEGDQVSIIELLGSHIAYDKIDFAAALNLHLLAIYIQSLAPEDVCDHFKMGQLLLRVAWLYRERGEKHAAPAIRTLVTRVPDELDAMAEAREAMAKTWDDLSAAIERQLNEFKHLGGVTPAAKYQQCRSNIDNMQKAGAKGLARLRMIFERDSKATIAPDDVDHADGQPFFRFPSHHAFLTKLKGLLPLVTTDEKETLRLAIVYLKKAVSSDSRFDNVSKYMSALSLIIDLSVRCDDIQGAFTTVRAIYSEATESRRRYQERLKDPELDAQRRKRIEAALKRVDKSQEQAADLRHQLLDLLMKRHAATIQEVLAQHDGAPVEQIEQTLTAQGVPSELFPRLKEAGGPLGA